MHSIQDTRMSEYFATIKWQRRNEDVFNDNKFSRHHIWEFDGGCTVPASPSPHILPPPMSIEENVDPEEAFVASLSSCHMLWFLGIAATRKYVVEEYSDAAVGIMDKNENDKLAMTKVTLRPTIVFGGDQLPTPDQIAKMHHLAHDNCFIANSVKTEVVIEGL